MATQTHGMAERLFGIRDEAGVQDALDAFAEDVVWRQYDISHRPAAPIEARGREQVAELLRKGLAPEMTHEIVRVMGADDGMGCHIRCTYPAGGRVEATYLMGMRDGRITEVIGTMAWDD